MGLKLTWGRKSIIGPLEVTSARLLTEEETLDLCQKFTPATSTEAAGDDYPRASLSKRGLEKLRRWIANWRHEHEYLREDKTGRECEAFAKALATDIRLFCEVDGLTAAPLVAWGRGFFRNVGHACVFVHAAGEWHSIDPRTDKLTIDRPIALYLV